MHKEQCKDCRNFIASISICVCKMDKILDRDKECKFDPSRFEEK